MHIIFRTRPLKNLSVRSNKPTNMMMHVGNTVLSTPTYLAFAHECVKTLSPLHRLH